jgi:hypothetical protein
MRTSPNPIRRCAQIDFGPGGIIPPLAMTFPGVTVYKYGPVLQALLCFDPYIDTPKHSVSLGAIVTLDRKSLEIDLPEYLPLCDRKSL